MTRAGTTTAVQRIRIRTGNIGTNTIRDIQQDLDDLNSLLVVSALRSREPLNDQAFKSLPSAITASSFRSARQRAEGIRISEFSMNSPWTAVLQDVASGATNGGIFAAMIYLFTRTTKAGKGALELHSDFLDLKSKRSETKTVLLRNKIVENNLRQQLKVQSERHKAQNRLMKAGLKKIMHQELLSTAEQEKLEDQIIGAARALTFIKSIEPEPERLP